MTIQITKKIVGINVQAKSAADKNEKLENIETMANPEVNPEVNTEQNPISEEENIRKMHSALAELGITDATNDEVASGLDAEGLDVLEEGDPSLEIKNTNGEDEPLFAPQKPEEFSEETLENAKILDYEEPETNPNETTYSLLGNVEITTNEVINSQAIMNKENTQVSTNKMNEMHELIERPEMLIGSTYKVKTPLSEHAMYITINDMILNEDSEQEMRRPFEVFINSKNMDHFQWIVALTRIISAVFRKGGDITFLVEELRSVFDPKGGYFKSGGQYMPSLVAEIGDVIECHLKMIGVIKPQKQDPAVAKMIEDKRNQIEAKKINPTEVQSSDFPKGAALCSKCMTNAVILMDGCMTCLNCGDSKCG